MNLRLYASTACLAILTAAGLCRAQMLPPAHCVPYDTSAYVVPAEKARAALAAFRVGDLRGVAQNLVARDSVVAEPQQLTTLATGSERLSRSFDIDQPEAFSEEDRQWIDALGAFCEGDDHTAVQTARKLAPPGSDTPQFDRLRLETLIYLRRNLLALAAQSADKLATSNNAADANLRELVRQNAGNYHRGTPERWLPIWESDDADSVQPLAVEFEFDAQLSVELQASESDPARRYRIVYRDLNGPPLVIAVCGPEMPAKEELVRSLQFPQYGLQAPEIYIGDNGYACSRIQLEALYDYAADLAPLAKTWIDPDPTFERELAFDTVLYKEVVQPLQERKAWNWLLRDRFGAGELNGLEIDHRRYGEGPGAADIFDFHYGPDGPPTWEVMAWVNGDVPAAADLASEPLALEHMHFAVGTGRERKHVASFRVVSEPAGNGRLYRLELMVNRRMSILDVYSEPPDFNDLRDKVRGWVNAWPKSTLSGVAPDPTVPVDFDGLNASRGAVQGAALDQYLARYGVAVEAAAETPVVVMSTEQIYGGKAARAVSAPNVLTQTGAATTISFRMNFRHPLRQVRFSRAGLIAAGSSGITHPKWSAVAYDENDTQLDSVGENLLSSFEDVPSKEFALNGPGITSIEWKSDARRFAPFSAVLIDNLEMAADR